MGFALRGPAITRARKVYFVLSPRPAPVLGPTTLITWKGPRFSPPKGYRGLSGAGSGPWPGVGVGKGKKSALPRATERARAGNFARGLYFIGPWRPRNEH